jgi:hypothetical protein
MKLVEPSAVLSLLSHRHFQTSPKSTAAAPPEAESPSLSSGKNGRRMTYQVVWLPSALDELAAIWLASSDRASVTAASHRIDERLATNPLLEGESRDRETERIAFECPLQVLARVSNEDRMVWVTAVAPFNRPS